MAPMGSGGGSSNKFSNNRGRPYAMMLLMAFGLAVFGVMVLHKLRERRIFNLLIKEKDHDIATLQLLLQKQKDNMKEAKTKIEELKAKAQSLRTQKIELNNKLMDVHLTTSSLKEEGRALESELEEKRNEIKMLREKEVNSDQVISQISALRELLKQKDTEIEDMKRRLENPRKVWSVSMDDPSKPKLNLSATEVVSERATNEVNKNVEEESTSKDSQLKEPLKGSETSTQKSEVAGEKTNENAIQEGKLQKFEDKQDGEESKVGGEESSNNGETVQNKEEVSAEMKVEKSESSQDIKGKSNETETVQSSRNENVSITTEGDNDTKTSLGGNGDGNSNNQQVDTEESQFGEGRLLGVVSKYEGKREVSMEGNGNGNSINNQQVDTEDSQIGEGQLLGVVSKYEGKREVSGGSESGGNAKDSGELSDSIQGNKRWSRISRNGDMDNNGYSEEGEEKLDKNDESDEDHKTDPIDNGDSEGEEEEVRGLYRRTQEEISADKPNHQNGQDGGVIGIKGKLDESNQEVKKEDEMVIEDKQLEDIEEKPQEQELNDVHKELPRRHSITMKRRRIPRVKKGRKSWKTTVADDNPEFQRR